MREPERYATPGETIDVTATVRDDDTPESQLTFEWSSDSGSFSGSGSHVTWTAPAATGLVTLRLRVRDTLGVSDAQPVSSSVDVAVHDSLREISDMVYQFLIDFSQQKLAPADVVRNFKEGCGAGGTGKRDEEKQVADNRVNYLMVRYSVGTPRVTINFGGICPFRSRTGDACAQADVSWTSTRLTEPTQPGDPPKGSTGTTEGSDQVTAEYLEGRWWLCDSDFNGKPTVNGKRPFMSIK